MRLTYFVVLTFWRFWIQFPQKIISPILICEKNCSFGSMKIFQWQIWYQVLFWFLFFYKNSPNLYFLGQKVQIYLIFLGTKTAILFDKKNVKKKPRNQKCWKMTILQTTHSHKTKNYP